MSPTVDGHSWSEESLFSKAKLYIELMENRTADDWQFGFWSALSLELLARSALAHISPVLLADNRDWRNIAHALGESPTAKKFSPRSLPTGEVFSRLAELTPEFSEEIRGFCAEHTERRNSELHSGELAFANLGTSVWLPKFYFACSEILKSMNKGLEDFFPKPEEAQQIVVLHDDAAAKAVQQDIKAHKQVWMNKSDDERSTASRQATTWATRHAGHRVDCPSCGSQALIQGKPSGAVKTEVDGEEIIQRQSQFPSSFECTACGLRITGLSKLSACGLGNAYTEKSTYTAGEFFDLYSEDELEDARREISAYYEPDFND